MIGKVLIAAGLGIGVYWMYTRAKPERQYAPKGSPRNTREDYEDNVPKACKEWPFRHKGHCVCLNRSARPLRIKGTKCSRPLPNWADTSRARSRKK